MSNSMWPHRWQPTRLRHLWDSPGKNTGVGCHFLLQCMKVKSENEVSQSCLTLSNPMDCSLPGSSIHGIFQARILEWVDIAFSNAWKWKVKVKSLSRVWLLATPWTAAYQAPPSMGFSRQEYWSGLPLPSPLILHYLITIPFSFIISHSPKWIPYSKHIDLFVVGWTHHFIHTSWIYAFFSLFWNTFPLLYLYIKQSQSPKLNSSVTISVKPSLSIIYLQSFFSS